MPAHIEVAGDTRVIAIDQGNVRSLDGLRELLGEVYKEIVGTEIDTSAGEMHFELEGADGRFSRLDDSKVLRQARLAAAKSLYVTARAKGRPIVVKTNPGYRRH